jgi:hypothetical protein
MGGPLFLEPLETRSLLSGTVILLGGTVVEAQSLDLDSSGGGTQTGSIANAGDANYYLFQVPLPGAITIHQDAAPGSSLDSFLAVFDGTGHLIASSDDSGGTVNSTVTFEAATYQSALGGADAPPFFVRAAGFDTSTGAYRLTISTVAYQPVLLNSAGAGSLGGSLTAPGAVDLYRFVAPMTGTMTVSAQAAPGSSLESGLTALDAAQQPIPPTTDGGPTPPGQMTFPVVAGQSFFVRIAADNGSTGAYFLTISTTNPGDDFEDDLGSASPIVLDSSGSGSQMGVIDSTRDVDSFQFVAPVTGLLTVRQSAAAGSPLDSMLTVYDAAGQQIAFNDNSWNTMNSEVVFAATAGETYSVQAAGFVPPLRIGGYLPNDSESSQPPPFASRSVGSYLLTFRTLANAHPIALDPSGSGTLSGTIAHPGEVALVRLVAPVTGGMTIRQQASAGSSLDSVLTVLDDDLQPLAVNDDSGGTRDSLVQLNVTAGQAYYVAAAGFAVSTGDYQLSFATGPAFVDDAGNSFTTATSLDADLAASSLRTEQLVTPLGSLPIKEVVPPQPFSGTIEVAGDQDVFRADIPGGSALLLQLVPDPGSNLDPVLTVFDGTHQQLAFSENSEGTRNGLVLFATPPSDSAITTLYVQVAAVDGSTGGYVLHAAIPLGIDIIRGVTGRLSTTEAPLPLSFGFVSGKKGPVTSAPESGSNQPPEPTLAPAPTNPTPARESSLPLVTTLLTVAARGEEAAETAPALAGGAPGLTGQTVAFSIVPGSVLALIVDSDNPVTSERPSPASDGLVLERALREWLAAAAGDVRAAGQALAGTGRDLLEQVAPVLRSPLSALGGEGAPFSFLHLGDMADEVLRISLATARTIGDLLHALSAAEPIPSLPIPPGGWHLPDQPSTAIPTGSPQAAGDCGPNPLDPGRRTAPACRPEDLTSPFTTVAAWAEAAALVVVVGAAHPMGPGGFGRAPRDRLPGILHSAGSGPGRKPGRRRSEP